MCVCVCVCGVSCECVCVSCECVCVCHACMYVYVLKVVHTLLNKYVVLLLVHVQCKQMLLSHTTAEAFVEIRSDQRYSYHMSVEHTYG